MYDVLDEAKNAVRNVEENAWWNHREEYPNAKSAVENFKDRIAAEELYIKEAKSQEQMDEAQRELTRIIDEIIQFNDYFNASMIPSDDKVLDPSAIDNSLNDFLNKLRQEQ